MDEFLSAVGSNVDGLELTATDGGAEAGVDDGGPTFVFCVTEDGREIGNFVIRTLGHAEAVQLMRTLIARAIASTGRAYGFNEGTCLTIPIAVG